MVDILIIMAVSATTTTPTETLTRSSIEGSAHTVLKGSALNERDERDERDNNEVGYHLSL